MWKSLTQLLFGRSGEHPLSTIPSASPYGTDWQVNHVMALSENEAKRLHHASIRCEHILLALVKSNIGLAHRALSELGIAAETVETHILAQSPMLEPPPETIEPSDEMKPLLEKASNEARYFKRKQVSSEHILLALMHFENSAAYQILQRLNVSPKSLRDKVYNLVECEIELDGPHNRTDPQKMERFTIRARKVLSISQQIAEERQDGTIGVEYLLMAMLREGGGVAWQALSELGVTTEKLEPLVYSMMKPVKVETKTVELTKDVKQTLEHAVDEARRRNHNYIGTEYLLLALMHQKKLVPVQALAKLGITPQMVRAKVKAILADVSAS